MLSVTDGVRVGGVSIRNDLRINYIILITETYTKQKINILYIILIRLQRVSAIYHVVISNTNDLLATV